MKKTLLTALFATMASVAIADTLTATPDIPNNAATTTGSAWQGWVMDFNDAVYKNGSDNADLDSYTSLTLTSFTVLNHGSASKIDDVYFAIYEVNTSAEDNANFTYTLVGTTGLGAFGEDTFEFSNITGTTEGSTLTLSATGVYAFVAKNKGTATVASGTLSEIISTTSSWTKRYGIINASETDGLTGHNYAIASSALTADRTGNVSYELKAVPEPTTATLSLLALAGLAARRRRK